MKGVILAAGKGTRLYPVTRVIPKPLLPLANRMTLAYAFDKLKEVGIHDICIVVGENEPQMRQALGDGAAHGVHLSYVRQTDPHGLAHAVGFAKEFVGGDDFMLYLGDAVYSEGFVPFVQKFHSSECANLNLVKAVEDPRRFGVANVEGDRIVKLVEKPKEPESNLAMAAMYLFGPELWTVLPDLEPSARGEYEITDAIQLLVDRNHTVLAGVYEGQWFDTGTLDSFLETSRFLSGGAVQLAAGAQLEGEAGDHVVVGEGASVTCSAIRDSVILPGACIEVEGEIVGSLLGGEVRSKEDLHSVIRYGDQTS